MKKIASGLLGLAACLYILGKVMAWGLLAAFAEAAMIGALADWFAVIALFRHPLGLPIPHTAIITKNKFSIANSLADFVLVQFLSAEVIEQRLKRYDAAFHLSQWLAVPANRTTIVAYLNKALAYSTHTLHDRRIHTLLSKVVCDNLQCMDLSGFMASGLELITQDQSHRKILHGGLSRLADYVESPDNTEKISAFIKGWSDHALVQNIIEPFVPTIRTAIAHRLRAAAHDETSSLYLEFDEQVKNYISRLHQDAELKVWLNHQKNVLLSHAELSDQIESLWNQLRDWVVLDLSHHESVIGEKIAHLVGELEQCLVTNQNIRSWINDEIQASLIQAANANKGTVGDLIREEFYNWDDKAMVNKLELYLGKDLQHIRINGTLVGGLFGLLIYVVTLMLT